ncbi:MAG: amino acid permease [Odoribacter sp.]
MGKGTKYISTWQLALMTSAAVISLRGLPMMAQEKLTMFFYIFFATFLFLIPAAFVAAELGSAFADRGGGVYTWVKGALTEKWNYSDLSAMDSNVVWYPTVLRFAAAAIAYMIGKPDLSQNGLFVGSSFYRYVLVGYLVDFSGTSLISRITSQGFLWVQYYREW